MFKGTGGMPRGRFPSVGAACRLTHSAAQTVGGSTGLTLSWDTIIFDTDGMHNVAFNTTRITCRTPGVYLIGGQTRHDSVNSRYLAIALNGGVLIAIFQQKASAGPQVLEVVTLYALNVGDYVELQFVNNEAANSATVQVNAAYSPIFWAVRQG